MKPIRLWFKNIIKHNFHTRCKNLLCTIVVLAIKKNLNKKYICFVVSAFNIISNKTKFHYVHDVKNTVDTLGTVAYSTQNVLCAAKPQFFGQNFNLTEVKKQNLLVLRLADAKIIGSSNVVVVGSGEAIYEAFFYDEDNRWDYTDTSICKYIDKSFLLQYRDSKRVIPRGIMLSGNYSWNYYHLVFEFLTKFFFAIKSNLPKDVPLIVDEVVKRTPQFEELLAFFNIYDREVIYIDSGNCYKVETLYYLPLLNIIPPNFKDIDDIKFTDCLFNLNSIDFLRETLIPKIGVVSSKKRIFLSRKNASSRRSYNESDVITIFKKYDFQIIFPEDYSISEQMYLFNNADFISGVTGAAFTNILFCNCSCKILCITPTQNELSIFSTIAKHLELDLQYLSPLENRSKAQSLHDEFTIDPTAVENALIEFLRK